MPEDQLQQLPAEVAPPPTAEGEQDADELNFLLLRQKVAEHMRQHAEEFKPFVLPVRCLLLLRYLPPLLVGLVCYSLFPTCPPAGGSGQRRRR